jgi:hypothetical protein
LWPFWGHLILLSSTQDAQVQSVAEAQVVGAADEVDESPLALQPKQ